MSAHASRIGPLASLVAGALLLGAPLTVPAQDDMPWGSAEVNQKEYEPARVVYDVAVDTADEMDFVLDRVSMLNNVYEADPFDSHIVLVLHGREVPFFTRDQFDEHRDLMRRAESLTRAGNIDIRMCEASAALRGIEPEDVHGFVEIVPMADSEIIHLQQEGYSYMQ
ncbi:DsrE family protein [Thioalkalivibrio sp. ALE19]|uniref:DsrE family protein n=1 Tax=Thioalkalivibrio sp. ALE19 TaxID=1266909 RepID=UPI00040F7253|nr:DsrE family protein [Thioalkalivibrio sp. ALE19]